MRNRFLVGLLAAALALFATPTPLLAQVTVPVTSPEQVGGSVTDDTDVALLIRYVGSEQSGTVEVETDGNLTFLSGDSGSEAADDALECPVSGALGGIVDVSDTACDTLVEVVDIINNSSGEWVAVPIAALGTDGTNDTFLVQAAAAATSVGGLSILWDTSVALEISHALTTKTSLTDYLSIQNSELVHTEKPESGRQAVLNYATTVSTYGSGDSFLRCYNVDYYFEKVAVNHFDYVEVLTTVYENANGSTTARAYFDQELGFGVFGKKDGKLVCRIDNSAALASATLTVNGLQFVYR